MTEQTVLVTGAASGIGLACARLLLEDGANVVAFDIQGARMADELAADTRNIERVTGDVSRAGDCERAVSTAIDRFGALDALIHWGAAHSSARWDELAAKECNRTLEVNVTGSFLIAQAAARHMAARGKGAIVLTTSTSVLFGVTGGEG